MLGAKRYEAGSKVNLLRYALHQNNLKKAHFYIEDLKELSKGEGWLIIERDILIYELKYYQIKEDYKRAFEKLQLYNSLNLKIQNIERSKRILEVERKHDLQEKEWLIKSQQEELKLNELIIHQKEKNMRITLLFGFVFILLSILLAAYYFSLRSQRKKLKISNQQLEKSIK
jgi:hypothetical protein